MRVFNYLIIIMGLMILMNLGGIPTVSGKILEIMDITNPEGFSLTSFFTNSFNLIAGILIIGGILIGLWFRSSPESYLLIGYASTLFLFVADMISVISFMKVYGNWAYYLVMLILGPLTLGYVHSIISWWGNKA